jgi:hypothetical protein
MARSRSVLALLVLTAPIIACSTFDTGYDDGPTVMGGTQTGVTVRYNPAEVKSTKVDKVATNFCAAYDKKPIRRGRSELAPDIVYQAYDCVAPIPANDKINSGSVSPEAH